MLNNVLPTYSDPCITLFMMIAIYMKLRKTEKYTQNDDGSIIACISDYTKKKVTFIKNDPNSDNAMQLCQMSNNYGPIEPQAFPALNEQVVRDYLDKASGVLPSNIKKYWLNTFYKVVFNQPPSDEYHSDEFDTACINLGEPFWGPLKSMKDDNLSDDQKQDALFAQIGWLS